MSMLVLLPTSMKMPDSSSRSHVRNQHGQAVCGYRGSAQDGGMSELCACACVPARVRD